jgi:nucleoside phosphorylase
LTENHPSKGIISMSAPLYDRLDEVVLAAMSGQRIAPDAAIRGPRMRLIAPGHAQASDIAKIRNLQREVSKVYGVEMVVIGGGAGCFTIEILVRNPSEDGPKIASNFIRRIANDPLLQTWIQDSGFKILVAEDREPDRHGDGYYNRSVLSDSGIRLPVDFSIVTALPDPEFTMLRKRLHMVAGNERNSVVNKIDYYEYYIHTDDQHYIHVVATYLQEVGTLSAATETLRILGTISPRFLIFVGMAGRIGGDDLGPGDVVIGEQIFHYDVRRKATAERTEYAPVVHRCDSDLLREVRRALQDADFTETWCQDLRREEFNGNSLPRALVGDIACGDEVVNSPMKNSELTSLNRKFKAVDTESAGMMEAIETFDRPVKSLVIRGISDLADGTKTDRWQSYASETAAAFAAEFIKRIGQTHAESVMAGAEHETSLPNEQK